MSSAAPVQNPQLHDVLFGWQQAAQPYFSTYLQGNYSRFAKWLIANDFDRQDSHLNSLPETVALLNVATSIPEFWAVDPANPPSASQSYYSSDKVIREVIAGFALQFLQRNLGPVIATSVFDDLYSDLELYLFDYAAMSYSTTIELWRVHADDPPVDLPPHTTIRCLTESEQRVGSTSAAAGPPPPSPDETRPAPELLIEIKGQASGLISPETFKGTQENDAAYLRARSISEDVLLGLRLLHGGDIGLGVLTTTWENGLFDPHRVDLTDSSLRPWRLFGDPEPAYVLTPEDAVRLQAFWPFLTNASGQEQQKLALPRRRFRSSFHRDGFEDRLIDQWIALESLFSKDHSELAHKVSQRLAQFIGHDSQDRLNIFRSAKSSYSGRSKIVHGEHISRERVLEWSTQTEDYLRRALIRCMEDKAAPIPDRIDEDIFLQGSTAP